LALEVYGIELHTGGNKQSDRKDDTTQANYSVTKTHNKKTANIIWPRAINLFGFAANALKR